MIGIGIFGAIVVMLVLDITLVSMSRKKKNAVQAAEYITDALELTQKSDTYLRTQTSSVKINQK